MQLNKVTKFKLEYNRFEFIFFLPDWLPNQELNICFLNAN